LSRQEIVIIDGARTAFAKFGGPFKQMSAIELGAITAREALARADVEAAEIDFFGTLAYGS